MYSFQKALGQSNKRPKPAQHRNMFAAFDDEDKENVADSAGDVDHHLDPQEAENATTHDNPPLETLAFDASGVQNGSRWSKPKTRAKETHGPRQKTATSTGDSRLGWQSDNWRDHGTSFDPTSTKARYHAPTSHQQTTKSTHFQYKGRKDAQSTRISKFATGAAQKVKNTMIGTKGVSVRYGNGNEMPGRRTKDYKILFSSIDVGKIYHHESIEPYEGDINNIPGADKPFLRWIDGDLYYKKGRYWIVIARTRDTVTEVPIYTFNDKALEGKDPKTWWEYFVICPLGVDPQSLRQWFAENPVLRISFVQEAGALSKTTMVAHVTEIRTRKVDVKGVKLTGGLEPESVKVVLAAAAGSIGKTPSAEDEV